MHDSDASPTFVLEGFLVAGTDKTLSIVLPPYTLEIDRTGVIEIEQREPLPGQDTDVGVAVRLRIRCGTRLWAIASASDIEERLWVRRRPFPMRTRGSIPLKSDGQYEVQEQAFLAARGIEMPS